MQNTYPIQNRRAVNLSIRLLLSGLTLLCTLLFTGCSPVNNPDCIVEGDLGDTYPFLEGKQVYLGNAGTRLFEDSAVVRNGKFRLELKAGKVELPLNTALLYKSMNPDEVPFSLIGIINPFNDKIAESYFYSEAGTIRVRADTSARARQLIAQMSAYKKRLILVRFQELPAQTATAFRHPEFKQGAGDHQRNLSLVRSNPRSKYLLDELYRSRARYDQTEMSELLAVFQQPVTETSVFRNLQQFAAQPADDQQRFPQNLVVTKPDGSRTPDIVRKGKYNLIVFWASWCLPCRQEIPQLKNLHAKYGDRLNIASLSVDRQPQPWHLALEKEQMAWDQFRVEPNTEAYARLDRTFDLSAIPVWLLFGPNGQLLERHTGWASGTGGVDKQVELILVQAGQ